MECELRSVRLEALNYRATLLSSQEWMEVGGRGVMTHSLSTQQGKDMGGGQGRGWSWYSAPPTSGRSLAGQGPHRLLDDPQHCPLDVSDGLRVHGRQLVDQLVVLR